MLIEACKLLQITESIPFIQIESNFIHHPHHQIQSHHPPSPSPFPSSSPSSSLSYFSPTKLDWQADLISSTSVATKSFTTATPTSTTFVLFTFFGFSSILFSHFAPILCNKGHSLVRRSINPHSSSHSNIQSIDSSSRRESAIKSQNGEELDSSTTTSKSVKINRVSSTSPPSTSVTTTTTTATTTTTTTSNTFPPILSTRIMNLMMQTSLLARIVGAHIGEPCNSLFKICLPPSPHIYCDENNICRCKNDYPVEIQPHTCKLPRKFGERCSHNKECSFLDPNAYCTKAYNFSECQCRDGYRYSYPDERCIPGMQTKAKPRTNEKLFLPSSIVFFLGCFGLVCCTLLVWYIFCQSPSGGLHANSPFPPSFDNQLDPLNPSSRNRRTNTGRPDGGGGRGPGGHRNNRPGNGNICRPPRGLDSSSVLRGGGNSGIESIGPRLHQLPSYDAAVFNQPPPSYDEAVKDTASAPTFDPESVNLISNQLAESIDEERLPPTSNIVRSSGMISLTLANNCINTATAPPLFGPNTNAPPGHSYVPVSTSVQPPGNPGNRSSSMINEHTNNSGNSQSFICSSSSSSSQQQQQNGGSNGDSTCITLPTSRI